MKIVDIANFTFKEYLKATGLYFEVALAVLFLTVYSYMWWTLRSDEVLLALGIFSMMIAFFTTNRIAKREQNPRIYILMTTSITRSQYLLGKLLAIFLVDVIFVFVLFIIGYFNTQMVVELSVLEGLFRLIPIFMVLVVSISLSILFSGLVLKRSSFFIAIIALIAGFVQPLKFTLILPIQQLIKTSYTEIKLVDLSWYLVAIFDILLLVLIAIYFFERRELDYELK